MTFLARVRTELTAMARQSSEQSWLQSFPSELPEPYPTYISFEGEARSLLNYEALFIPGLLQTEEYARAALTTIFEHLRALALPPDASVSLVMSVARDL